MQIYPQGDKIYPDVTGSLRLISKSGWYCEAAGMSMSAILYVKDNIDEPLYAYFIKENNSCIAEFSEIPPGNHRVFVPITRGLNGTFGGGASFPITVSKGRVTKVEFE